MIKQRSVPRLVTEVRMDDFEQYYDLLIVPQRRAPVLVSGELDQVIMKPMRFSLIPRWAKEPKLKFATHNARIESVADKPTWRDAFQKRHCLVPLTHFIEPIYEGEHAGFMVAFQQKNSEWLLAAGIWEEWANRETGEVIESFTIITSTPPPSVASVGHDRCPIFLTESAQAEWLKLNEKPTEMLDFLESSRLDTNFEVKNHRAMRPGWEKRKS